MWNNLRKKYASILKSEEAGLNFDSEWMELEVWIGLDIGELDSFGWRGEDQGNNLKVNGTQYWFDANSFSTRD